MKYHLVCVHPFDSYVRGQLITDATEVEKLLGDRDHHFVRIPAPAEEAPVRRNPILPAASL